MKITYCAPFIDGEHFDQPDRRRTNKLNLPVHTEFGANGDFRSNGISMSDYERMTTQTHKLSRNRCLLTPDWVLNIEQLQKVLVAYIIKKSGCNSHHLIPTDGLMLIEQLEAAQKRIKAKIPGLIKRLDKLCSEYVAARKAGKPMKVLEHLAEQITALDKTIITYYKPAAVTIGVIYYYFNCGLSSTEVAYVLRLSPCSVRQIIHRLRKCADDLNYTVKKNPANRYKQEVSQ